MKALRTQAANAISTKEAAAKYYEENGTLAGFEATNLAVPKPPTTPSTTSTKKTIKLKSGVTVTVED